ncbi:hypothetical protein MIR68_008707 [Amoeboaphelidium protococcarum]|nr:hypothetical protein MIR68_008707 [Amoeboaphelidium protococcarum]
MKTVSNDQFLLELSNILEKKADSKSLYITCKRGMDFKEKRKILKGKADTTTDNSKNYSSYFRLKSKSLKIGTSVSSRNAVKFARSYKDLIALHMDTLAERKAKKGRKSSKSQPDDKQATVQS